MKSFSLLVTLFSILTLSLVVTTSGIIFSQIINPSSNYYKKLDVQTKTDLRNLTIQIDAYFDKHKQLPESLDQVPPKIKVISRRFPISEISPYQKFEYTKIEGATYRLCAKFYLSNGPINSTSTYPFNTEAFEDNKYYDCYNLSASGNVVPEPAPNLEAISIPTPIRQNNQPKTTTVVKPIATPKTTVIYKQTTQPTYITNNNYQTPSTNSQTYQPASTPQPSKSPATSCQTLGGIMIDTNGTGTIGCDVKVNGAINMSSSYCEGQTTKQRKSLIPDGYGKEDQYYATLGGLDPDETVKVFVESSNGLLISCGPDLNK